MPPRIPSINPFRNITVPRCPRQTLSFSGLSSQEKDPLAPNAGESPLKIPIEEGDSYAAPFKMISMLAAQKQRRNAKRLVTLKAIAEHEQSSDLEKMMTRRWVPGDVYAPHDLSPAEMKKWRIRANPSRDVFDALSINPIDEYKVVYISLVYHGYRLTDWPITQNFSIMSEYVSPMGRIKHSRETGLRPKNQRRIAKAIRRAIGLGLMPSVHKHPELLERAQRPRRRSAF
ncbi:MAG: hypothetical protein M1839_000057 [Geoglossum umbratile]|nr:MAG: hypothetical protein M1839_000057 [Geoglossum umbratile]